MPFDAVPPNPARAIEIIDAMLEFFGPQGENWFQGEWQDRHGARCTLSALRHTRHQLGYRGDSTAKYIRIAMRREGCQDSIIDFNDSQVAFYQQLRDVLISARAIAEADLLGTPRPRGKQAPHDFQGYVEEKEALSFDSGSITGEGGASNMVIPLLPDPSEVSAGFAPCIRKVSFRPLDPMDYTDPSSMRAALGLPLNA